MTNKETITINGLIDGISVVENDNKQEQPFVPSDKIFNDEEPNNFEIPSSLNT